MSQELEEQQRITNELEEQLRSLTADHVRITEQIKIIEAKLSVQGLRAKVKAAIEENNKLRAKKQELESRLESQLGLSTFKEQMQIKPSLEESPRTLSD